MSTLSLPDLCRNGNLEDVRRALAKGEDVNKATQYGVTGLMWAVYQNQNAIVELLLSQPGLDLNVVDGNSYGWTAIHYACYHGNFEGLKMMLAHSSVNSHNVNDCVYNRHIVFCGNGRTPLMLAIHRNNMLCISELLKVAGLDLDTGSETLSVEARRLIDEEKQRREMEEVQAREEAAMLKREEEAKMEEKEVLNVGQIDLDTLETLSVEVQRLIDEEKKKWKVETEEKEEKEKEERKKQEEAARSKREGDARKEKEGKEECLEKNNQALRETEERVKRMIENCAKTIEDGKKECKELMDEFKLNVKAENAARFSALELTVEEMKRVQKKECKDYEEKEKREKAENSAKFAALELTIKDMIKNQRKAGSVQVEM